MKASGLRSNNRFGKSHFLKLTLLKKITQGKRVYVAGLKTDTEYLEFFTKHGFDSVQSRAVYFINKDHEREVSGYNFFILNE